MNPIKNFFRKAPSPRITLSVYDEIRRTIGSVRAETGGMLGGSFDTNIVDHFHLDTTARMTGVTYSPNAKVLTKLLKEEWGPAGIRLLGFVHSHPGTATPSDGDIRYATRILDANEDMPWLLLPIVSTQEEHERFACNLFIAHRASTAAKVSPIPLHIFEDGGYRTPLNRRMATRPIFSGFRQQPNHDQKPLSLVTKLKNEDRAFARVKDAYDLNHLARCRMIYVGTGGAASFIEDTTRAGVGDHILIDPDVITEENIATQQVYRRDFGRNKVDCISHRLHEINPLADVQAIPKSLDDIDDVSFEKLVFSPLKTGDVPTTTLLCGLTDNFGAQARVNRLALHLGIPSLCAGLYHEGRGAEITFTYPGVTPACHRCILSSRYDAYLEKEFQNITSSACPIYATTRLNSLKGFVALALIHHATNHERWGDVLTKVATRNLLQIRLDPSIKTTLGVANFDQAFAGTNPEQIFFDETIWRPQLPEAPNTGYEVPCPDCGGFGDLRKAKGTFKDTRVMNRRDKK